MIYIGALTVTAAIGLWWRTRYLRAAMETGLRRRPLGPDGIVIGAEGFVHERHGAPAVLLLHGAGDTPQTLRYLADALYERGFHVSAPLLPGHGRTVADFARVRADDLIEATREHYRALHRAHPWLGVIGLSMGGALAVQIAAENPELPALGLVAPYLAMPATIEGLARTAWLWGPFAPVLRSVNGMSVLDPVERDRSLAYGVFTPAALRALWTTMRRAVDALPRVVAPTLMIQSREDNRISVADAERAFALLGAREKRLQWITGAAHVITVDYGRDVVIASLVSWMESRAFNR
ncbi:MAG TPA: alpha/beta fold hydrolase [Gemmatimonadaceae bacterium]|nr:alpha/beta fold hydrolase [Gemmatimonadaceae bacterium]